jgi:hypothetical protein
MFLKIIYWARLKDDGDLWSLSGGVTGNGVTERSLFNNWMSEVEEVELRSYSAAAAF